MNHSERSKVVAALLEASALLSGARRGGASFGKSEGFSYAVKVDGLSSNDFYKRGFGAVVSEASTLKRFKEKAKKGHVRAKGKDTLRAVRAWVKENRPSQFYARWKSDSPMWKDDSVEIYYLP